MDLKLEELAALGIHLSTGRERILRAWREAADADPAQTTVSSLTRSQFNDHIPQLLHAFERKLGAHPGSERALAADAQRRQEEIVHGLQRWQLGYKLEELMHEWGHLHRCLFEEVVRFSQGRPDFARETFVDAQRQLLALINDGINESAGQYARMQRAEAAGHVSDLQRALTQLTTLDRHRAKLIHQAVHDLRGNVQSVTTAAEVLRNADMAETERAEFADMVQQGVEAITTMLGELMSLARLEAGQEKREIAPFDAGEMVAELCSVNRSIARDRNLFLQTEGPPSLTIEGDCNRVRRLLQNLLLNALKYTTKGGVTVGWGEDKEIWWLTVKDTGPGMLDGPGSPIVAVLKEATVAASATQAPEGAEHLGAAGVLTQPQAAATQSRGTGQPAGEGIGLSIVKRLCELLDASLEMASAAGAGTTFRVVFPRRYQAALKKE